MNQKFIQSERSDQNIPVHIYPKVGSLSLRKMIKFLPYLSGRSFQETAGR